MNTQRKSLLAGLCISLGTLCGYAHAEPGDRIAPGDTMPSYQLQTSSEEQINSTDLKEKVTVLIYVIAKQHGSERAIADASMIIQDLDDDRINLLFVSANEEQSDYFAEFWETKEIKGRLGYDPDRKLYSDLGLIAFPTTLVTDLDGKVMHLLSTHSPNYPHLLDGYIRHSLGLLDDAGLEEHLKARSLPTSSPKSIASRHRAVARLMREKGLFETAESELLEALGHDTESLDIRVDLADLYLHLGRLSEANEYIHQVQRADARHRHAMLLEGILLYRQSNYDEAQRVLSEALVLNPDPSRTHYYLGRVYEAVGNTEQALDHYRQALGRLLNEPID